ncbi:MAG: tRNA (cytidine(56)-2'-O)-methyltransferase [Nitrososphaerota archaeon]
MAGIEVLRLGHRIERDKRLTTHVGLAARAFGASKLYYSGDRDKTVETSIAKVVEDWGGEFEAVYVGDWRRLLKDKQGEGYLLIHLTMYGLPIQNIIDEVRRLHREKNILVIVGGEKVERAAYIMADYNVSVTSQPHSEVSALAVFLDWLQEGRELEKTYADAKKIIIPSARGKTVKRRG